MSRNRRGVVAASSAVSSDGGGWRDRCKRGREQTSEVIRHGQTRGGGGGAAPGHWRRVWLAGWSLPCRGQRGREAVTGADPQRLTEWEGCDG